MSNRRLPTGFQVVPTVPDESSTGNASYQFKVHCAVSGNCVHWARCKMNQIVFAVVNDRHYLFAMRGSKTAVTTVRSYFSLR